MPAHPPHGPRFTRADRAAAKAALKAFALKYRWPQNGLNWHLTLHFLPIAYLEAELGQHGIALAHVHALREELIAKGVCVPGRHCLEGSRLETTSGQIYAEILGDEIETLDMTYDALWRYLGEGQTSAAENSAHASSAKKQRTSERRKFIEGLLAGTNSDPRELSDAGWLNIRNQLEEYDTDLILVGRGRNRHRISVRQLRDDYLKHLA
jgi:hypothetical protein